MRINEPRHNCLAGYIDHLGARGDRDAIGGTHRGDTVAYHHDRPFLDHLLASHGYHAAIDECDGAVRHIGRSSEPDGGIGLG